MKTISDAYYLLTGDRDNYTKFLRQTSAKQ